MARNFRIESLSTEDRKRLEIIAEQYFPSQLKNQFIDSIESTGAVSPDLLAQGGFSEADKAKITGLLSPITSKLPTKQEALKTYVASQTDVPNLTDAELKDRQAALKALGTEKQVKLTDPEAIGREIESKLSSFGIPGGQYSRLLRKQIMDFTARNFRLPNAGQESQDLGLYDLTNNPALINNFLNDQDNKNYFSGLISGQLNPLDKSADIKTVEDIIADRAKKSAANADIMSFFETAPGDLTKAREAFFDPQRTRAKDYIQQVYAPGVRERLAARGLQNSGEVASSVTSKYADLFGAITDSEANQLVSEQQSYDKTFSDLVNAGADVRGTIASERGRLRTQQITDFAKRQSDIESRFNFDLFREQSKAAYDTYRRQTEQASRARQDQGDAELFSEIGKTAATLAIASAL